MHKIDTAGLFVPDRQAGVSLRGSGTSDKDAIASSIAIGLAACMGQAVRCGAVAIGLKLSLWTGRAGRRVCRQRISSREELPCWTVLYGVQGACRASCTDGIGIRGTRRTASISIVGMASWTLAGGRHKTVGATGRCSLLNKIFIASVGACLPVSDRCTAVRAARTCYDATVQGAYWLGNIAGDTGKRVDVEFHAIACVVASRLHFYDCRPRGTTPAGIIVEIDIFAMQCTFTFHF